MSDSSNGLGLGLKNGAIKRRPFSNLIGHVATAGLGASTATIGTDLAKGTDPVSDPSVWISLIMTIIPAIFKIIGLFRKG